MKSKKILSVLLSAMLLFVSVFSVSAVDKTAEIDVNVEVFAITVTVKTDAVGQMNLQIVNKANDKLAAMTESTTYTTLSDGRNEYSFLIKMQPTHATGTYTVRVGNNVAVKEKDFEFVNAYDIVVFFNTLNSTAVEGIHGLLCGENCKTSYDLTAYRGLSQANYELVDAVIADMELAATLENVAEVENSFKNKMNEIMPLAILSDAKTDSKTWTTYVKKAIENKMLDSTYANKVSLDVVEEFFKENIKATLDEKTIAAAFDDATILTVVNELDYITIKDAIAYYVEKEVLDIDTDDYDAVVEAELDNDLAKEVKNRKGEATDVDELEDLIDEIAGDLLQELEEEEEGPVRDNRPSRNPDLSTGAIVDGSAGSETKKEEVVYSTQFADMGEAVWAAKAVEGLAAKGYVSGRGDGNFYPNDVMTREEFVKLIVVSFNAYDEDATVSFEDVVADRWSYSYIASANRLGLVTGISETAFNPAGSMTREDMAVIMYRLYDLMGLSANVKTVDFADANAIAGYAKEAVSVLAGQKVLNGMGDGTFAPKATVTRAQASKVVYELLALIGGVN